MKHLAWFDDGCDGEGSTRLIGVFSSRDTAMETAMDYAVKQLGGESKHIREWIVAMGKVHIVSVPEDVVIPDETEYVEFEWSQA